jgi:hypothetical protein
VAGDRSGPGIKQTTAYELAQPFLTTGEDDET